MPAASDRLIIRNTVVLFAAQGISFATGLVMLWIVPRSVGAAEWGEWTLAWAMASIMASVCAFGLDTLLVREIARRPEESVELLGAGLTARVLLSIPFVVVLGVISYTAHYTAHTRLIIALVVAASVVTFISLPAVSALQAQQRMHFNSLGNLITSGLVSIVALVVVKFLALGIVAISIAALVGAVLAAGVQFYAVGRQTPVRPSIDWRMVARLLYAGLPFWASSVFLTLYVWIDSVMLSLMTSTAEVGWYGASTKLLSTLGIIPYVLTMAIFPAVSRSYLGDMERVKQLARTSIRLAMTLVLPMVLGLLLVGPQFVRALYGWSFSPAGPVLSVLALTLPPIFFATIVNALLIAADRQVVWTWVMAACCVVNPIINLFAIRFFEQTQHNGALGASVALGITDGMVGVAAFVLLPPILRQALKPILGPLARAVLATAVMGVVVWFLADRFVVIPIFAGIFIFTAAALLLRVFQPEDGHLLKKLLDRLLSRMLPGRVVVDPAPAAAVAVGAPVLEPVER